ncbi:hypothetical protein FA09DRAFT_88074 [Tilletiopsis washingtonensis]|jgi:hypothetical protein|uniref:Uncharacterized protein n=1 Tax=Tilletiopsis washingtonensis TaxID=58919 RepID=A0A316Z3S8_9BASI|nr:hypothetical protein FA09DRAFT_88074 [Tilletiopsis washingtonensis]PWN96400.1 hypothetical protein FA09DRAFT_88074 [Tilletiopsis washingtonensis]
MDEHTMPRFYGRPFQHAALQAWPECPRSLDLLRDDVHRLKKDFGALSLSVPSEHRHEAYSTWPRWARDAVPTWWQDFDQAIMETRVHGRPLPVAPRSELEDQKVAHLQRRSLSPVLGAAAREDTPVAVNPPPKRTQVHEASFADFHKDALTLLGEVTLLAAEPGPEHAESNAAYEFWTQECAVSPVLLTSHASLTMHPLVAHTKPVAL